MIREQNEFFFHSTGGCEIVSLCLRTRSGRDHASAPECARRRRDRETAAPRAERRTALGGLERGGRTRGPPQSASSAPRRPAVAAARRVFISHRCDRTPTALVANMYIGAGAARPYTFSPPTRASFSPPMTVRSAELRPELAVILLVIVRHATGIGRLQDHRARPTVAAGVASTCGCGGDAGGVVGK